MPARALVALIVSLGIVLPHGVAALALTDSHAMVICTGDGLRTIRIGADGAPVELSQVTNYCALAHATEATEAASPEPAALRLLFTTRPLVLRPFRRLADPARPSLPRAPPVA